MRRTLVRLANPVIHTPVIPQASPSNNTNAQKTTPTRTNPSKLKASQTKNRPPPLSLEHFLLRSRVLNLYRTIIRAIYQIPDKDMRKDPVAHAKAEFGRNKDVRETAQIRYLVSTGKAEWDGMRRYIDELALMGKG
jgi:hypothetical protein